MKNLVLTFLLACTSATCSLFAQLTLPYTFENNSEYADSDIYIGLVGKMDPTGDVFMDVSNSTILPMSADYNTMNGPE